jgi:hypothetical protein
MKRFRLSAVMLLIVIAALCVAMIVQNHQAVLRERGLQLRMESLSQQLAASRDLQAADAARRGLLFVLNTSDRKEAAPRRQPDAAVMPFSNTGVTY